MKAWDDLCCLEDSGGWATTPQFLAGRVSLGQVINSYCEYTEIAWGGELAIVMECSGMRLHALARFSNLPLNLWRLWAKKGRIPKQFWERVLLTKAHVALPSLLGHVRRDGRSISKAVDSYFAQNVDN